MTLSKQTGANTCWALCIKILQHATGLVPWPECCIADTGNTPSCGHAGALKTGSDRPLHAAVFAAEAGRCGVDADPMLSIGQADLEAAMTDSLVTMLSFSHYRVVLSECGSHWCIYDPTWGDIRPVAPKKAVRNLAAAWQTSDAINRLEACCDA